jgi:sugar phosphate isomerase/epimerase
MIEVAKWANDLGQTVVLQNHAPLIRGGYEDSLAMVNEINMDNFKLCLDVPLFIERQSDEYIREAVDACSDLIVMSHYGAWNFRRNVKGEVEQDDSRLHINYPAYIRELKRINFNGYLIQEQCSPVVKDHEYQGVEEVDRLSQLAIEYMQKLLAS